MQYLEIASIYCIVQFISKKYNAYLGEYFPYFTVNHRYSINYIHNFIHFICPLSFLVLTPPHPTNASAAAEPLTVERGDQHESLRADLLDLHDEDGVVIFRPR
jgi:hypothetical protein